MKPARNTIARYSLAGLLAVAGAASMVRLSGALADELPTFTIEMKDGIFTPDHLTVPAGKDVKIVIKNTGTTPGEFESQRLRQEKVLAPGAQSFVVLRRLSAGDYTFFDDFHPGAAQGVITAK
jgi:hypothetical protein